LNVRRLDAGGSVAVSVQGLRKRYGETVAVDGVSFDVARGEIFGIIGPNGSGKTTTVECLQGLRHADAGELRVLGLDPRTHGVELRRRIGCQLQESALPERIRVWEALDLFAALAPQAADWRRLVRDWGLEEKRDAFFHGLSGGQRQRLFVALALVNQPEVVFLDEMTTGLDPAARRVAWELIGAVRAQGTTVVLVTHFMEEAERLCDRLVVFDHGRIVAAGTPADAAAAALGIALADVVNLIDPDTIVLGGTYASLAPWLVEPLGRALTAQVIASAWRPIAIRASLLGPDAAVRGAAAAVVQRVLAAPGAPVAA
jgi:ABC-2 type transport system ATP-binding protein